MDNENLQQLIEEAEQNRVCPVCGDLIDGIGDKCCDKCMLDIVGVL